MTRVLKSTSQYKRDLKRYRHDADLISTLTKVISDLAADIPLKASMRDHDLHNNWEGCRECHVKPDVLLVYRKTDGEIHMLLLERLGSHSNLFG